MQIVEARDAIAADDVGFGADDLNPFIRFGPRLAWWAFARAHSMSDQACRDLTEEVAGDFAITPWGPAPAGLVPDGVELWVKDETHSITGSQKVRHLLSIMLHLRACEELGLLPSRPPLAIASCGNAALAAATLAQRVRWPIEVFVPEWMDPWFGQRLDELGAEITRCERRAGDPPGDPALHRFREAVAAGAIPFSVQGPQNAYCLDGGRTIGWEIHEQASTTDSLPDRIFVQTGGGAFAACVARGLGPSVALHPVQAERCAPLMRAWQRLLDPVAGSPSLEDPPGRWSGVMTPWPSPHSLADGICDDETYDWLAVIGAMHASGGSVVVASEDQIQTAWQVAHDAGLSPSPTGAAGLAGVLAWLAAGSTAAGSTSAGSSRIAVIMSGIGSSP
jgi:threonine dehydratase